MKETTLALTRRRLLQAGGLAAATVVLPGLPDALAASTVTAREIVGDPLGPGYWILLSDGSVVARGSARRVGGAAASRGSMSAVAPVRNGGGFWRLRRNGAVRGFGTATLRARKHPRRDSSYVAMAANPAGTGLWRVTRLGMVTAVGSVTHLGRPRTAAPVTAMAAHPAATGYWILNRAGRVFGFGASKVMGAAVGSGATGIAAHPSGDGYWVVRSDGSVSAFGVSQHYGNAALGVRAVGIAAAPDGAGYWVLGRDGRVRAFGSARSGVISLDPPPDPTLATVGGIVVSATISRRVGALLEHARDDGIRLGGWGYRSYSTQVQLRQQNCGPRYYDVYVKPSSQCSPMTARPGASMHERGEAVDFYRKLSGGGTAAIAGTRAFKWMTRNAKTYGLYNLPSEPWHWSTNGR